MSSPRVIAVIITYNPDGYLSARVTSYADQISRLVVVDNSTAPAAKGIVDALAQAFPHLDIIRNATNAGIATAQNTGIDKALAQGAEWVLLLDDDSVAMPGMIDAMFRTLHQYPKPERIALIAPRVVDKMSGVEGRIIASEGLLEIRRIGFGDAPWIDTALTAIASGSLIRAEVFASCGKMRDDYFIDGVDIEYCLRLRCAGWRLLMVRDACLRHRLGAKTTHLMMGLKFVTSNHPVWRRYTMYRNRMDIWINYFHSFPGYVAYDFLVSIFELFKIALFEKQKGENLRAILHGVIDRLRGRFPRPIP